MENRIERLLVITRRLIIMTAIVLAVIAASLTITFARGDRLMTPWLVFGIGLLGGFVSIQQRLRKLGDEELLLLSQSWFQVFLIPVYGGVFALVLYVTFLSQIVTGDLFPHFAILPFAKPTPVQEDVIGFLRSTIPASGQDLAKLLFWSFVAGFSERFVPQILQRSEGTASPVEEESTAAPNKGIDADKPAV